MRVRLASGQEVLWAEQGDVRGLKQLLAERLKLPRFRQRLLGVRGELLDSDPVEEEMQLVILDFWTLGRRCRWFASKFLENGRI